VGRSRFVAVGTHLSKYADERVVQGQLLKGYLAELDEPYVVCGDLNEEPGGGGWRTLADGLTDAAEARECGHLFTFSCASPRRRIDGVFVDPAIDGRRLPAGRLRSGQARQRPLPRADLVPPSPSIFAILDSCRAGAPQESKIAGPGWTNPKPGGEDAGRDCSHWGDRGE
jgi:hypothetical protein